MLVIRRKTNEAVIIGETISVKVLAVEGDRVKIGISAPADVAIVREEILHRTAPVSAGAESPLEP